VMKADGLTKGDLIQSHREDGYGKGITNVGWESQVLMLHEESADP